MKMCSLFAFLRHGIVSLFVNCRQHNLCPFARAGFELCVLSSDFSFSFLSLSIESSEGFALFYYPWAQIMFTAYQGLLAINSFSSNFIALFILQESDFQTVSQGITRKLLRVVPSLLGQCQHSFMPVFVSSISGMIFSVPEKY